ncbi:unnamed protein product [Rhodiola kirilowii]
MAATSSYMSSLNISTLRQIVGSKKSKKARGQLLPVSAQLEADVEQEQVKVPEAETETETQKTRVKQQTPLRPVEPQINVKSKNMSREYAIRRATQMDKLTLLLDTTNEFVWTTETCNKVYSYFQELVDHYEGAPLTEYTLRLIGSDIEHYIRKMLYDGGISYNMNARVLNFSMGKPRVIFNNNEQPEDV